MINKNGKRAVWKQKSKRIGIFQIFEIDKENNKKKQIDEFKNIITSDCLNKNILIYAGYSPNLWIKYLATGDDNTAVNAADSTLGNERYRIPYTSQSNTDTGELTTDFYIPDGDSNFTIEELGIFAGSAATSAADTGNMVAHVLWNYPKTSSLEILVRRIDTIS